MSFWSISISKTFSSLFCLFIIFFSKSLANVWIGSLDSESIANEFGNPTSFHSFNCHPNNAIPRKNIILFYSFPQPRFFVFSIDPNSPPLVNASGALKFQSKIEFTQEQVVSNIASKVDGIFWISRESKIHADGNSLTKLNSLSLRNDIDCTVQVKLDWERKLSHQIDEFFLTTLSSSQTVVTVWKESQNKLKIIPLYRSIIEIDYPYSLGFNSKILTIGGGKKKTKKKQFSIPLFSFPIFYFHL